MVGPEEVEAAAGADRRPHPRDAGARARAGRARPRVRARRSSSSSPSAPARSSSAAPSARCSRQKCRRLASSPLRVATSRSRLRAPPPISAIRRRSSFPRRHRRRRSSASGAARPRSSSPGRSMTTRSPPVASTRGLWRARAPRLRPSTDRRRPGHMRSRARRAGARHSTRFLSGSAAADCAPAPRLGSATAPG